MRKTKLVRNHPTFYGGDTMVIREVVVTILMVQLCALHAVPAGLGVRPRLGQGALSRGGLRGGKLPLVSVGKRGGRPPGQVKVSGLDCRDRRVESRVVS